MFPGDLRLLDAGFSGPYVVFINRFSSILSFIYQVHIKLTLLVDSQLKLGIMYSLDNQLFPCKR